MVHGTVTKQGGAHRKHKSVQLNLFRFSEFMGVKGTPYSSSRIFLLILNLEGDPLVMGRSAEGDTLYQV